MTWLCRNIRPVGASVLHKWQCRHSETMLTEA
ncbi:TPA: hypothetical protein N0F65_000936 [Lagenidium giganteum]|uniref:Uncharacterized protein n=1 Tax=Lagenidium giganteum TaxID=4803 RepID=A0AAV2YMG0_9STRA|nr:TPA: hypothetical protein N0F65_000936 [Lagenidium giganteum]